MKTMLSIITMFKYSPSLFDDMVIPAALDKDLLTDNLMLKVGELEVLYNDPEFMQFAIGRWSNKELDRWEKLYNSTVLSYDPIENYNRTESSNEKETRALAGTDNETRNLTGSSNETRDLTGSSANSGTDTQTMSKTGFDSATFEASEQDATLHGKSTAITDAGTVNNAITDSGTVNTSKTDTGTVDHETTSTIKGNIGVTTTQQMIEQERKVLEYNIYDNIVDEFKTEFCIMVW